MSSPRRQPDWEVYERMIARLAADQIETSLCVTPNARLKGKLSGRSRQIDVLIDTRHDTDNTRRIIVDAKKRSRKIDVRDVEAFRGLMEDVGATHGYLICPVGHTRSAEKRAQGAVSIRLVPLHRIENFDPATWPRCRSDGCKHGRVFWDGYPELSLVARPLSGGETKQMSFVHHVGKCDRCGMFHVLCTTCKDILSVPTDSADDFGHQCQCRPLWFWIASIERDADGNESAELHSVFGGKVETVDRRSL